MKKHVHITGAIIGTALAVPAKQGLRSLEPLKSLAASAEMPMQILEENKAGGDAEVHAHQADLWFCLEGASTFTLGGKLINERQRSNPDGSPMPNEFMGDGIDGGEEVVLHVGEWLWIPRSVPHQHRSKGITRLVIIKI